MRRRSGRPGLLGTMARTAVIAGTANAVTTSMQRSDGERTARDAAAAEAQHRRLVDEAAAAAASQLQPAVPAAPTPPTSTAEDQNDPLARLTALSDLRERGLLSEAEFTAAKAHLLGL